MNSFPNDSIQIANIARYRASHPFVAAGPNQLSFGAGAVVLVDLVDLQRQQNGWVFAHLDHGQIGWVPLSYLVPDLSSSPTMLCGQQQQAVSNHPSWLTPPPQVQEPQPHTTSNPLDKHEYQTSAGSRNLGNNPTNPFDDTYVNNSNSNDDGGFGGPAMGGEWTSSKDIPVTSSFSPSLSSVNTVPNSQSDFKNNKIRDLGGKIGPGLKDLGMGLRQIGKNAGSSISSGTKKAAEVCRNAATEAKYRVGDMKQQHHQQQGTCTSSGSIQTLKQDRSTAKNQAQWRSRTQGEQMQINAANGAAKAALIGGAVGLVLSGGNVASASRTATRHAAFGGAYGAARDWKPFGN